MHTSPRLNQLILALGLFVWASPVAADDAQDDALSHVVRSGETLSGIAKEHGVALDELLAMNPDLDADHIREGQRVVLDDEKRRIRYTVQAGDTLVGIAKRHDVGLAQLVQWNSRLSPDRIREGQQLTLWTTRPRSESLSVGTPNEGRLERAQRLPQHPGIVIRARDRAFGTAETVAGLLSAVSAVRKHHPRTPRVRVHDLSLRGGGPMSDHRSHQSGRDADLSFFQKDCPKGVCPFRRISADELDVERTWTLLRHWLERDELESVFMDYKLQAPLYRHARKQGATDEELRRWFQYPSGRTYPLGVIRHFPKHQDHLHVRFVCHHTDESCKSFRPLLTERAQAAQAPRQR